jgi:hypothetical protein
MYKTLYNYFQFIVRVLSIFKSLKIRDSHSDLDSCDVMLICHDADRSITIRNLEFSPLIDSVGHELMNRGLRVEFLTHPFSNFSKDKAYRSPKTINRKYLLAAVQDLIGQKLGIRTGITKTEELWHSIFDIAKPKVIVTIGAPPEMCRAACSLGISSVEILHGYRYEVIPWGYDSRTTEELPEYFLSLDELSTATFGVLRNDSQYCKTIENPWYEFLETIERTSDSLHTEWSETIVSHLGEVGSGRRTVLVCLQWGYSKGEMFQDVFKNELFPFELQKTIVETTSTHDWIFRLHPVQLRGSRYRQQRAYLRNFTDKYTNAKSYEVQQIPLPMLLKRSDYHMSPGSGSTAEALKIGVPSLVLDNKSSALDQVRIGYQQEIDERKVTIWNSTTEHLLEWLNTATRFSPRSSTLPSAIEIISSKLGE